MDTSRELFFEADSVISSTSNHAKRTRRFSLAIIVVSALCVFNSIYNTFTSDGLGLYSSILFLLTSLVGIMVGALGFHSFKKGTTDSSKQYMMCSVAYAVIYIVNTIICSILQVFEYLAADEDTTTIILISTFLACYIFAAAIVCILHVYSSYNYNKFILGTNPSVATPQASFDEKLGLSSSHPIRTTSVVQEIQLKNTRNDP
mmetsp:Transcript_26204/g.46785  ORF Transcript_26204/g.46785 Transcript_26204/m.46785 type:complete len:203 (+) Transcript_26204:132-740(+)